MQEGNRQQGKKYAISYEERMQCEAAFYDRAVPHMSDAELIVPVVPSAQQLLLQLGLDIQIEGKQVLDCGCGYGQLAVWLALHGAIVTAIDVSPVSLDLTLRRAAVNGVEARVRTQVMNLEHLEYPAEHFDLVVGRMVLHHVDVEPAGKEILRVLKQEGYAIFEENSASNPLLMLARRTLTGRMGIPRHSDSLEYPLTNDEVHKLANIFGGRCVQCYHEFLFFRLLDDYILQRRFASLSGLLHALDQCSFTFLPFLRKYSYNQILIMRKPSGP